MLPESAFAGHVQSKIAETLDDAEAEDIPYPDERKMTVSRKIDADCERRTCANFIFLATLQLYSNLFFLLQAEPRHVASLCRMVNLSEIDTLLQTVMFTLYGNQYESREEHLLLTMFQVSNNNGLLKRDVLH